MANNYGYIRASTEEQRGTLITQKDALKEAGCKRIFVDDDQSGKTNISKDDTAWHELLATLEADDRVIVNSHSRLGRKNHHVVYAVGTLVESGVTVHVLDGNITYDDPDNLTQLIMLNMRAVTDHNEGVEISKRTKASLALRKKYEFKLGQKPKLSNSHVAYILALREEGLGFHAIANAVRVYSKKYGRERPISSTTVQKVINGTYGMTVEEWQDHNDRARAEMIKAAEAVRRVRIKAKAQDKEASDA